MFTVGETDVDGKWFGDEYPEDSLRREKIMDNLEGRVAVVVAGGNGIGRSIALALADAGVDIVVADYRGDDAEKVRAEIAAKGRRAVAVKADVKVFKEVEHVADVAYNTFGKVDILVNNAGVALRPFRAIWDASYADMEYVVGTNVWGLLHGLHAFLPRMVAAPGDKHIVNTSSMASFCVLPGNALYGLTKGAIDGLSHVIREELAGENIGVTILYPGLVNTTAAARSNELRSPEDQKADSLVRNWFDYAASRGDASAPDVGAGRGKMSVLDGEEIIVPIEPEAVGPIVVEAIRHNRPFCMTHPAPVTAIRKRTEELLRSYRPIVR